MTLTEYECEFLDGDTITIESETRASAFRKARRNRDADPVDIREVKDDE